MVKSYDSQVEQFLANGGQVRNLASSQYVDQGDADKQARIAERDRLEAERRAQLKTDRKALEAKLSKLSMVKDRLASIKGRKG